MRLLKFDSRDGLTLTKNFDENIPHYAILSHTWGPDDEEVTFKDLESGSGKAKAGYDKILFCGEQARRDGLQYFWVDTCCIDKADHTELSEAITSMFRWYRDSVKCYVYLSDVSVDKCDKNGRTKQTWESAFRSSRWFARGWTLQELIAPRSVEFFSREGELLGDKKILEQQIHEITGIPTAALRGAYLSEFGVDERLQWAENRKTRKKEDKAYCLLGIFNVFMPLIYGEGENAFIRLKAEIERSSRKLPKLPETALTLAKLDEATKKSLNESRLTALDGLEKFASSSSAPPSDEFHQSIREAQQHEEEVKRLERYDAKPGRQAPPGRRRGVVEKWRLEFEGEQQTLSHNQRAAPGLEALILKSIIFGAEENRERDGQIRSLITRLAADSVSEVQNHTSNLAVQMREAAHTQKELIDQCLHSLQYIKQTVDVASPHITKLPRSRPLKKRKLPTGALRRVGVNIQGTLPNLRNSKERNTSSVFQQKLCKPAAWQRGIESWLAIIFLASGTAYANPSIKRTLHRLRACAHDEPVLALIVFVAAMCILRFCYPLPPQISLLSDSSVSFEDAFGSRLRIPFLQCSEFEIFRGFLEVYYKHRPGLQRVLHKQYLILLEASQPHVIDLNKWSQTVKPRSRLTMFMVMISGKYTCPKCQSSLDTTQSLHVFCQNCDEFYMIAGTQALAEGSSVEELQDEQEDEDEGITESGPKNFEDGDEYDVVQNSNNVTATWEPGATNRNDAINRVAEVDRMESTFKHMALSQSKKRQSFEDAEMIFKSYRYPDAMYPVRPNSPSLLTHRRGFEHYRLEKRDYSWTESSRTKLNTSQHELLSLTTTSASNQLLKGFRRMSRDRRAEIYRLLNDKNAAEPQADMLWYVTHINITKSRTKNYGNGPPKVEVFCMEIVIERVANSAFLYLRSLNGTFENKKLSLPFYPEVLRFRRQVWNETAPTSVDGYFDCGVVSRQHAEVWASGDGKVFIRDVKSSNGTFVNGQRLSPENRESEPHELRPTDTLELGIDIVAEDGKTIVCRKISAIVDFVGFPGRRNN